MIAIFIFISLMNKKNTYFLILPDKSLIYQNLVWKVGDKIKNQKTIHWD